MSQSTIHAVFQQNSCAGSAIEALVKEGFEPRQFSIIGTDDDSFRQATATLQSTKVDKLMIVLGIIGAAAGTVIGAGGVRYLPGFDATYITIITLTAAFSGLAVGMVTGLATGAIVRLDRIPPYEAEVRLGTVHDGDLAVSVRSNTLAEQKLIQSLFVEHGAKHIDVELSETELLSLPTASPSQALPKIA